MHFPLRYEVKLEMGMAEAFFFLDVCTVQLKITVCDMMYNSCYKKDKGKNMY